MAKTICLTLSVLLEAPTLELALAELELELALAELELELELELEHPAVPSRPAMTTVAPSQVAVRRLKMFTKLFVCDPSDARHTGVRRAGERLMTRREPNSTHLLNARLGSRAGSVLRGSPT
jgi:hypothetical protein